MEVVALEVTLQGGKAFEQSCQGDADFSRGTAWLQKVEQRNVRRMVSQGGRCFEGD